MTLVIFDLPDELGIPYEALEDLAQKTSFFSLSTEWRWFGGAHLTDLIIAGSDPPRGDEDVAGTDT